MQYAFSFFVLLAYSLLELLEYSELSVEAVFAAETLFCRNPQVKQWRRFEVGFKLPSIKKFRPERILIKPYAFWPSGNYRFDNLSLRRATKAEVEAVNAQMPSIKEVLQ